MLRRLGPLQRLDARIYLTINGFPHPRWSDRGANLITVWATGGWVWAGAVLVARLFGVPGAGRTLRWLLPSMVGATWIVEYPVKAYFRRRRPFIDIVRALVVGKRPGSWSFPSGHTASSFACATVLSATWPRAAPIFYALASIVGLSRIYVGAHYPGDVLSGAFAGTVLSEGIRRLTRHIWPQT
jgi:undecaprenyl-diphosphatase